MAKKCKIYILVGEKNLEIMVDSSRLPKDNQELYSLLSDKLIKLLADNVEELLMNRTTISSPNLNQITNSSHIIANATIDSIRKRYPELRFPDDSEDFQISDVKVLFLNEFKTLKGELKYGRFINPNGEEIFIIDRSNVNQVVNYFTTLKKIQTSENVVKLLPYYEEDLNLCLNEVKKTIPDINTTKDLLVMYLLQKFKFRDLIFNNSNGDLISIYAFLDDVTSDIFEISTRKTYSDPTINNINKNVSWNKNLDICSISTKQFFLFLDSLTKQDLIKTFGENYEELIVKNELSKDRVKLYFGLEGNPLLLLVTQVLSKEPDFTVNFYELKNKRIYMKKFYPTLEKVHGIGFEELLKYEEPIYYNGKWIQKTDSGYFVTKFYTTETQIANKFNTLKEAKEYILDNRKELIVKNSLIDLHKPSVDSNAKLIRVKTDQTFLKGTLIAILDYNIPDIPINTIPSVDLLFLSTNYRSNDPDHKYATMEDFHDYVKNVLGFDGELEFDNYNYIIKKIDTPEKVALFIMELNNGIDRKNNVQKIKDLAKTIGNIKNKRYYLVENSTGHYTTLLKINNESTKEYRSNYRTPVISLWNGAKASFEQRLGLPLSIDLEPEEGKENAKAYIKDNVIHINLQKAKSSDLLHEYAHILLGYLKIYNRDAYLLLINTVWKIGDTDGIKYYINRNYADSSLEDRMEEYFVEKFGQYITGKSIDNNFEFVFNSEIIEETKNIFTDLDIDIKELYGSSIEEVFLHFSSDISAYFKNHKTLMDSDFKELFKVNRQKSEWVRRELSEERLIEYDCK